jgi:GT2 family glycosyltransferase
VISIVVVTHNRLELLRRCVENVLCATSPLTRQIIIWDNASLDGTREYLEQLDDPRMETVHHHENIAMNARRRALAFATQDYLIEMDDDIVDAPSNWDEVLLKAYVDLEKFGRLAPSLQYDPTDTASRYLKYLREELGGLPLRVVNGIRILEGNPGGGCTMISRELYNRVGGYREHRRYPYWRPEIPFERKLRKLGFRSGFLADLEVRHAGGHSEPPMPKSRYYHYERKLRRRKDRVKRILLAVPFFANLNDRFDWFDPPVPPYDPAAYDPEAQKASSAAETGDATASQ